MTPPNKHGDRDYITARQDRYIEAYRSGEPDKIMEFMDEENLTYSDFGGQREGMKHSEVKSQFQHTFTNFHDLKIKTLSLHGHKHFTAWEWEIRCKPALGADGNKIGKEDAQPRRLVGCTLMWWSDDDKIVQNHDYVQAREP